MKLPSDINRTSLETIIDEWIVGNQAERNRAILKRSLIDGIRFEKLAEEFDLSVKQVKRIVRVGYDKIFSHWGR